VKQDLNTIENQLFAVWRLLADIRDGKVNPKGEVVANAVAPCFRAIEALRRVRAFANTTT
jgi:hypothetical protein